MMSGKDLFVIDPTLFIDDDDAASDYDHTQNIDEDDGEEEGEDDGEEEGEENDDEDDKEEPEENADLDE